MFCTVTLRYKLKDSFTFVSYRCYITPTLHELNNELHLRAKKQNYEI
jgi:hypothetical protein